MKTMLIALAAASAAVAATPALAVDAPAAAAAAKLNTSTSTIGELLANPAAKAVLMKHIPALAGNPQMEQAGTMTLKAIQSYAADQLTDAVLAKIDADLAAIK